MGNQLERLKITQLNDSYKNSSFSEPNKHFFALIESFEILEISWNELSYQYEQHEIHC